MATKKTAAVLKAEKADKAAKAKAAKEKKESLAANKSLKAAKEKAAKEKKEAASAEKAAQAASDMLEKAAKAASDMLEKAKKEEISYSPIVTKAYSKKWRKEELVHWVESNYDNVNCIEMNNKQIAFSINGTRVPLEGFLTVS